MQNRTARKTEFSETSAFIDQSLPELSQIQTFEAPWHNRGAMLSEWFERLHGYDKWNSAIATVQSIRLSPVGEVGTNKSDPPLALGWEVFCEIRWEDQNRAEHHAVFRAFEESPLYQLCEGDTVNIRINLAEPSEYYLPTLMKSEFTRTWKLAVWTLLILVLGIGFTIFLLAH
jgi:hypothetical protein